MVDVFNSSRSVLLTYLDLTETQIALISTIYIWASALTQPCFGWILDRVGPRWLDPGFIFSSDALGMLTGPMAEHYGFPTVLVMTTGLVLLAPRRPGC